jgi:hypothetical protein
MIGLSCYQLSQTHSLSDVAEFVGGTYLDVVEWGVDKITKGPDGTKLLPSWEQIQNETQDAFEQDFLSNEL